MDPVCFAAIAAFCVPPKYGEWRPAAPWVSSLIWRRNLWELNERVFPAGILFSVSDCSDQRSCSFAAAFVPNAELDKVRTDGWVEVSEIDVSARTLRARDLAIRSITFRLGSAKGSERIPITSFASKDPSGGRCIQAVRRFCLPPSYDQVWEIMGLAFRLDNNRRIFEVQPQNVVQAGAKIHVVAHDMLFREPTDRFKTREFADGVLYFRTDCNGLRCRYEATFVRREDFAEILTEGLPRLPTIEIIGASPEGLARAQRAISSIAETKSGPVYVPLSELNAD